jgi:predicted DNA-binding protein YlxM (UPF0122 family)
MLKWFYKFHDLLVAGAESIINPVAFFLSAGFLVYFYINISDYILLKIVFGIAALYVDFLAWYTYGKAHTYIEASKIIKEDKLKTQYRRRAAGLRVCTVIYLVLCSGPADVSFFITELGIKEQVAKEIELNDKAIRDRIKTIDDLTITFNQALKEEIKTKYRSKSQSITDQINALTIERANLLNKLTNKPSGTFKKAFKNPFNGLAEALGVEANSILLITFSVLVFMFQWGLFITPWNIYIKGVSEVLNVSGNTSETSSEVSEKASENHFRKPLENLKSFSEVSTSFEKPFDDIIPGDEFELFIENMYKTPDGRPGSLRGSKLISDLTGIPLDRVIAYKNKLCHASVFDKPLASMRSGVCETSFDKKLILEYIRNGVV